MSSERHLPLVPVVAIREVGVVVEEVDLVARRLGQIIKVLFEIKTEIASLKTNHQISKHLVRYLDSRVEA